MDNIPALEAYAHRIGAERLNFKRYMVKEFKGNYYTEKVIIKVGEDGEIHCSEPAYAPTAEEAAAIRDALRKVEFPKAIKVNDIKVNELDKLKNPDSVLYKFYDRKDGDIIFVQEAIKTEKGKVYVPWTYFSDGEWRKLEPDGQLPFWKPKETTSKPRIMIHEGAKAAEFANSIPEDHPWASELADYEHWGIIGGALAPHRADYNEVRNEKPVEVVYVCDNDFPGKAALQEVSKLYGGSMKGVRFDQRWPEGWDIADPMPEDFYKNGRYLGPTLQDCMKFATRATERVPHEDGGKRMKTVLKRAFREEWVHSVAPEVFIHKDWPSQILTAQEFNNMVRPYSDVDETSRIMKTDDASKSAILKYDPSLKAGIYAKDDTQYINTHKPSRIKAEKGDPTPFLEFMEMLIPKEEDRTEAYRWIATLIARPEIKMLYGMLLISETQGVGKGTLGERILAPLVGHSNVSYPSEAEITDSNYNYWLSHKRLAVVHEIYAGHSSKAYNRLKSVITDRFITVSKKYQANYEIDNWIHLFACSNSMRAIKLSSDDRRWFVPMVTEEKKDADYWERLNEWLEKEGGLSIIKWWAEAWVKENGSVLRGSPAPWSALKKEVVEEGYSPGQELVAAFLHRIKEEKADERVIIMDTDLVRLIRMVVHEGRLSQYQERPLTVRKVAKSQGWFIGSKAPMGLHWDRTSAQARFIASLKTDSLRDPRDLDAEGVKPLDVLALARDWGLNEM